MPLTLGVEVDELDELPLLDDELDDELPDELLDELLELDELPPPEELLEVEFAAKILPLQYKVALYL